MSADIRELTAGDIERWKFVQRVAFIDTEENTDRWARFHRPEWCLAAFVDGELQASVSSIPFAIGLEGSNVRMGGVTSVACMPEYRRQGLVAELLKQTLERSRAQGEPVSGLWTPHPALYRRYGWEVCADLLKLTFVPKNVTLASAPRPAGAVTRGTVDDWKTVDAVYRTWGERRNSLLVRDETRWRLQIEAPDRVLYIYRGETGEPEGHAILNLVRGATSTTLRVFELVATTSAAYRALLAVVLSHDLVESVTWLCPPDEPVLDIVVDPGQVKRAVDWGLFLRVVDVAEAFSRRPTYGEGHVVIRLEDKACPWNEGVWEVASRGSHLSAEPCDEEPALTLDARALAQLYNGYRSPTLLARTGRLVAHHPRALAVADILFGMRTRPFCMDDF